MAKRKQKIEYLWINVRVTCCTETSKIWHASIQRMILQTLKSWFKVLFCHIPMCLVWIFQRMIINNVNVNEIISGYSHLHFWIKTKDAILIRVVISSKGPLNKLCAIYMEKCILLPIMLIKQNLHQFLICLMRGPITCCEQLYPWEQ